MVLRELTSPSPKSQQLSVLQGSLSHAWLQSNKERMLGLRTCLSPATSHKRQCGRPSHPRLLCTARSRASAGHASLKETVCTATRIVIVCSHHLRAPRTIAAGLSGGGSTWGARMLSIPSRSLSSMFSLACALAPRKKNPNPSSSTGTCVSGSLIFLV